MTAIEQLELTERRAPEGLALGADDRLAREAQDWMHSPHGRQIMRMLYADIANVLRDADAGQRISMDYIIHRLRFRLRKVRCRLARRGTPLETSGGYALNDHHTAYISRHVGEHRPEWAARFEKRRLGRKPPAERKTVTIVTERFEPPTQ